MSDARVRDDGGESRESITWSQARRPLLATVGVVVAMTLAALLGLWAGGTRTPGTDSADAGFARDMSAHHAQAVDMSMTMLTKNPSSDVRVLAYDVARTQENQRGQMMGWLAQWNLPLAVSGERMQWMARAGHQHSGLAPGQMLLSDGRMPGMASPAQLQQLAQARGKDAEIRYLRLMIVHHRAGVEMAQAAVADAGEPQVVHLARTMVTGQRSEIDLMTRLLAQRGVKPWSDTQAGQR